MKKALVIVGHGSREKGFQAAMDRVAREVKARGEFAIVLCAYLKAMRPALAEAIESCAAKGAAEVRVLPYFLSTGRHVTADIPRLVAEARERHRGKLKIRLCPYLGFHQRIVSVVLERARRAK